MHKQIDTIFMLFFSFLETKEEIQEKKVLAKNFNYICVNLTLAVELENP